MNPNNQDIYNTNSAQSSVWGDFVAPAITTAAQIGYNIWANNKNNKFNAAEAEKQRQWETEMSNTAVTRAMQDYKNAGMNPHLATGGGPASTPSGSAAATTGMMPINFSENMQTALTHAQISNLEADTSMKNKQSGKTQKETEYVENKIGLETALNEVQQELIRAQTKDAKKAAEQKQQLLINQMIQNLYEFETGQKMPSDALSSVVGNIKMYMKRGESSPTADVLYQMIKAEIDNYTRNSKH